MDPNYYQRNAARLREDLRRIREARPLSEQATIAKSGQHPITGRWWPSWVTWDHVPNRLASIMTRWSGARASYWGRIGGRSRSVAKRDASISNGKRHGKHTQAARQGLRPEHDTDTVSSRILSGPIRSAQAQPPSDRGPR